MDSKTKERIERMRKEFSEPPKMTQFNNEIEYDEIIVLRDIPFQSLCEHHHLAFSGKAHIGYLPNKKIVGLSKLARSVEYFLNPITPTIQEGATKKIIEFFVKEVNPRGCGVVLEGQHSCCQYRGIKSHGSVMVTSSLFGLFHKPDIKDEFFRLIGK